jgi:hypothetical protein
VALASTTVSVPALQSCPDFHFVIVIAVTAPVGSESIWSCQVLLKKLNAWISLVSAKLEVISTLILQRGRERSRVTVISTASHAKTYP